MGHAQESFFVADVVGYLDEMQGKNLIFERTRFQADGRVEIAPAPGVYERFRVPFVQRQGFGGVLLPGRIDNGVPAPLPP